MYNKQRAFLIELHKLCESYNISMITVMDDDYITMISNGQRLAFKTYADGQYSGVKCIENYGDYIPEDDDDDAK